MLLHHNCCIMHVDFLLPKAFAQDTLIDMLVCAISPVQLHGLTMHIQQNISHQWKQTCKVL